MACKKGPRIAAAPDIFTADKLMVRLLHAEVLHCRDLSSSAEASHEVLQQTSPYHDESSPALLRNEKGTASATLPSQERDPQTLKESKHT